MIHSSETRYRGTVLFCMFTETRMSEVVDSPLSAADRRELTNLVERQNGQTLDCDGRRLQAFFPRADAALAIARELHGEIDHLRRNSLDRAGLSVKSVLGYGEVSLEQGRLTSGWAYQMSGLLAHVPPLGIAGTREFLDQLEVSLEVQPRPTAKPDLLLLTETSNDGETRMASLTASAAAGMFVEIQIRLRGVWTRYRVSDCPMLIGREASATVQVQCESASRQHGRIDFERGKFMYYDLSRNGSYILAPGGEEILLREGENMALVGEGAISCGAPIAEQTGDVIRYACKSTRLSLDGDRRGETRPMPVQPR